MSVVAMTGCSGYIGSHLLRFMDESADVERIVGVDVNECRYSTPKMEFHKLDVRDPSITDLFIRNGVDTVVHLAFIVNPLHDDALMHDIDVNGARNVLSATSACGAGHLVLASSSSAFGALPDNPEWLTEKDHLSPSATPGCRVEPRRPNWMRPGRGAPHRRPRLPTGRFERR